MITVEFSEREIAQSIVLLKAKVQTKALPLPMCVELAAGAHEGWIRAAKDYLIARRNYRRYAPATLEQPDWEGLGENG